MKDTHTKTEGIYTITGKRWTKAGHDRMYITIDIEKDGHSYKELSKAAVGCLCGGDWWIDMTTGDVMHKEIPSKVSSWHVTAIEKLCAEMYTDLVADAQEAIVEPKRIMMTEEMAEDMGDMVAWDRAQMDTADDVYEGGSTVGVSYADLMVTYDVMDLVADAQEAPKSRIIKSVDDLESWDIDNLKIMIHRWIMDTDYATDEDDAKRWDLTLTILKDLIKAGVYDMCAPKAGKNFIKDLIKKYTSKTEDTQIDANYLKEAKKRLIEKFEHFDDHKEIEVYFSDESPKKFDNKVKLIQHFYKFFQDFYSSMEYTLQNKIEGKTPYDSFVFDVLRHYDFYEV